jgi:hypothetical protein
MKEKEGRPAIFTKDLMGKRSPKFAKLKNNKIKC